jgi:Zn-dependent peptidase ImmA (M78 family)
LKFEFKHYQECGIPVLNRAEIEKKAYALISEYDGYSLANYCKPPVVGMLGYLENKYNLKLFSAELGLINDNKIYGRTIFSQNRIYIDASLSQEGALFMYTAAHEVGHWVLHRSKPIKTEDANEPIDQIDDCQIDLSGENKQITVRAWMERQANDFAAAFLMPKEPFLKAVVDIQRDMGINRNLGKIILSRGQSSQKNYQDVLMGIQRIFGISLQAIKLRLKTLGMVHVDNDSRLVHISKILPR